MRSPTRKKAKHSRLLTIGPCQSRSSTNIRKLLQRCVWVRRGGLWDAMKKVKVTYSTNIKI